MESIVRPGPRSAPPLYTPLNLCWDDEKDEPFLPLKLRDGLEGYRLTPSREEDGEDMVGCIFPFLSLFAGWVCWLVNRGMVPCLTHLITMVLLMPR